MSARRPAKTGKKQEGNQGRFRPGVSGNPRGRPEGSRNRATLAIESLLAGEAEALTRKLITKAKRGNIDALKYILSRIIPPPRKDRTVSVTLPEITTAVDISKAFDCLLHAIADGTLTPGEGQAIASVIEANRRGIELSEIEARLSALEERTEHGNKKQN